MPIFKNFYNEIVDVLDSLWDHYSKVRGVNKRLESIAEFTLNLAKSYCPIRSGVLFDSIESRPYRNGYIISIYGEGRAYGKFVEYGTGIVGRDNPHPRPPSSWVYNAHFDEYGKDWIGFEPRAFMYNTYVYLTQAIASSTTNSKWYKVTFTSFQRTPAIIIEKR